MFIIIGFKLTKFIYYYVVFVSGFTVAATFTTSLDDADDVVDVISGNFVSFLVSAYLPE